jgi:hypothetical protein
MKSNLTLTSLAASAGKAHGAVVEGAVRAAKTKGGPSLPLKGALAQLRDAVKLPKRDYDKLDQIVALVTDKPGRPVQETLLQIQQIDEELQGKAERVHPLVLAIASIANDSATTNLAATTPASNGGRTQRSVTRSIKVVAADVAGAVLGGIAGAKVTKEVDIIIAAAIGGAIFASSTVGAGQPFPGIGIAIIVE